MNTLNVNKHMGHFEPDLWTTSNENSISAIHFVHLAEINIMIDWQQVL